MNEWVWSIGGMILTGETEVPGEKPHIASVVDEWISMEHWWNDTDRGNWSTGRKTLYSVGGRWVNEYGALVEWYWQGKPEVLEEKHYATSVVDEWMSMLHWWNNTDRGENIIQRRWYMNEWVWSIGGMILAKEKWSIGRKTASVVDE